MDTKEKIVEEIKTEVLAELAKEDSFKPIGLRELFSIKFPENKWVIKNIIPYEGITIISGAPASYKTWLILQMAISIARGESLFKQFPCDKNNILIIDEENHLRLIQERLKLLSATDDLPIYFLSQKGFIVSDKSLVDKVLKICQENDINIIFIDSLVRINNAEENDASQMSEVFRCIRQLCQSGKTVVITHHERKEGNIKFSAQNRLRGSSDIQAAVDAHIALKRFKDDKSKILIEQAKLREAKEIQPFEVSVIENGDNVELNYVGLHSEEISKKDLAKEIIPSVLEEENNGLPRNEIIKKVREIDTIGEKAIKDALDDLIEKELVLEKSGHKNTKICYLPKYQKTLSENASV